MRFTAQELLQLREFIDFGVRARGIEVAECALLLTRKIIAIQQEMQSSNLMGQMTELNKNQQ